MITRHSLTYQLRKIRYRQLTKECLEAFKNNPQATFAWHLHHGQRLVEKIEDDYSFSRIDAVKARINFVVKYKDTNEIPLRLKLFRPADMSSIRNYSYYLLSINTDVLNIHKEQCPNCPWDGTTIFSTKSA